MKGWTLQIVKEAPIVRSAREYRKEGYSSTAANVAALLDHMGRDKKVRDGRITYVLVRGIGEAFLSQDVDPRDVEALLTSAIAA